MALYQSWPVPFVLIRHESILCDDKLCQPGNNGRKIVAAEVMSEYGERLISTPHWRVPEVLATGSGGIEVATFTESAKQDRHKHAIATEIYTVLRGTMGIYLNDQRYDVGELEEVVVLPGTVHQVVESLPQDPSHQFQLIVRVHTIDCHGVTDKYVQLDRDGEWYRWDKVCKEARSKAYKM